MFLTFTASHYFNSDWKYKNLYLICNYDAFDEFLIFKNKNNQNIPGTATKVDDTHKFKHNAFLHALLAFDGFKRTCLHGHYPE